MHPEAATVGSITAQRGWGRGRGRSSFQTWGELWLPERSPNGGETFSRETWHEGSWGNKYPIFSFLPSAFLPSATDEASHQLNSTRS